MDTAPQNTKGDIQRQEQVGELHSGMQSPEQQEPEAPAEQDTESLDRMSADLPPDSEADAAVSTIQCPEQRSVGDNSDIVLITEESGKSDGGADDAGHDDCGSRVEAREGTSLHPRVQRLLNSQSNKQQEDDEDADNFEVDAVGQVDLGDDEDVAQGHASKQLDRIDGVQRLANPNSNKQKEDEEDANAAFIDDFTQVDPVHKLKDMDHYGEYEEFHLEDWSQSEELSSRGSQNGDGADKGHARPHSRVHSRSDRRLSDNFFDRDEEQEDYIHDGDDDDTDFLFDPGMLNIDYTDDDDDDDDSDSDSDDDEHDDEHDAWNNESWEQTALREQQQAVADETFQGFGEDVDPFPASDHEQEQEQLDDEQFPHSPQHHDHGHFQYLHDDSASEDYDQREKPVEFHDHARFPVSKHRHPASPTAPLQLGTFTGSQTAAASQTGMWNRGVRGRSRAGSVARAVIKNWDARGSVTASDYPGREQQQVETDDDSTRGHPVNHTALGSTRSLFVILLRALQQMYNWGALSPSQRTCLKTMLVRRDVRLLSVAAQYQQLQRQSTDDTTWLHQTLYSFCV